MGGATDWSTDFLNLYDGLKKKGEEAQKKRDAERIENTNPSLPLVEYAGSYLDTLYGKITVSVKDDQLVININDKMKANLSHWHYDTFRGPMEKKWFGEITAQFQLDTKGKVSTINVDGLILKKAE